jgi:hypothetical protein
MKNASAHIMNPTKPPHHKAHRLLWPISLMVVLCLIALVWSLQLAPWRTHDGEPPWIYGAPDARFTIIEYADLECPYCRAYYPQLRIWIDAHHDVNWQWHHFPLTAHEPAARIEAKLVECIGRADGQRAFWSMRIPAAMATACRPLCPIRVLIAPRRAACVKRAPTQPFRPMSTLPNANRSSARRASSWLITPQAVPCSFPVRHAAMHCSLPSIN